MIDATATDEFALRLPAVYSQGFAQVRVVTSITNVDDPGPLAVPAYMERAANDRAFAGTGGDADDVVLEPVA